MPSMDNHRKNKNKAMYLTSDDIEPMESHIVDWNLDGINPMPLMNRLSAPSGP